MDRFWVIFDTCTRPEYYQDVHNILALPKNSIIRYNYNEKYLDKLAEQIVQNSNQFPEHVLLVYGEFDDYKKGNGIEIFRKNKDEKKQFRIVPTRICKLINLQKINEEVYFDLQLKDYPYPSSKGNLENIITSLDNNTPFNEKSKYISISGSLENFNFLKTSGNDKDNWASIIKEFQNETQFKDDSFWRIEGPYKANGDLIDTHLSFNKESQSSYLNHYVITEGEEFYFNLYNYEPRSTIKYDTLKTKILEGLSYDDFVRKVIVDDRNSPVVSFLKSIELRQYFISKIKFQKNFNPSLATKEGACYFSTNGQVNEWPIGANFYLYFQLKKSLKKVIFSIILVLIGTSAISYSSWLSKTDIIQSIIMLNFGTLALLISSILLYRQIKTKI